MSLAALSRDTQERVGELAGCPLNVSVAEAMRNAITTALLSSSRTTSRAGGASRETTHQAGKKVK